MVGEAGHRSHRYSADALDFDPAYRMIGTAKSTWVHLDKMTCKR